MAFLDNTRKPVGFGGKVMVRMMNLLHGTMAHWGLQFLPLAPDARVLDCGCGGGANIRTLLKKCPRGIVKGVDYSAVSAETARCRILKPHASARAASAVKRRCGRFGKFMTATCSRAFRTSAATTWAAQKM